MSDWKILDRPLDGPLAITFAVGVAAGALFGWVAGSWPAVRGLDWLGLLTAIGTVGAVFVALWQTKRAHQREDDRVETARRLDQDRTERRANLAAAGLALRLESIEHDVDLVATRIDLEGVDLASAGYEELLRQFELVDLAISLDVLLAIAPLPDDCSDDVASGLANLAFTRSTMLRWKDGLYGRFSCNENRKKLFDQWSSDIQHARAVLGISRKALVSASRSIFF